MNHPPRPGSAPWRPQGPPYYLENEGSRLGLSALVTGDPLVKGNRQLARIGGLTAEVCLNFHRARLGVNGTDLVRATLSHCEAEVAKTHAIAAAATAMVDEAYAAFGMEPPPRRFAVAVADVTELAALRAEVERLRAENEALADRLTSPAPDPDSNPPAANGDHPAPSSKSRPAAR